MTRRGNGDYPFRTINFSIYCFYLSNGRQLRVILKDSKITRIHRVSKLFKQKDALSFEHVVACAFPTNVAAAIPFFLPVLFPVLFSISLSSH